MSEPMNDHPGWDVLNDFADGLLDDGARRDIERHVAVCEACRSKLDRLGALLQLAEAAPEAIDPPNAAWPAIRARVSGREPLRLEAGSAARLAPRRFSFTGRWLAAAALLLVAGSAAVTALVLRRGQALVRPAAVQPVAASARLAALPSDVRATERDYVQTAEALEATLAEERAQLSPETVAVVERSLRVIDEAIDEARAALIHDPANAALRDLWSRNHQQKLDLLRRATELVQKT